MAEPVAGRGLYLQGIAGVAHPLLLSFRRPSFDPRPRDVLIKVSWSRRGRVSFDPDVTTFRDVGGLCAVIRGTSNVANGMCSLCR